jgi:hypothetical protein
MATEKPDTARPKTAEIDAEKEKRLQTMEKELIVTIEFLGAIANRQNILKLLLEPKHLNSGWGQKALLAMAPHIPVGIFEHFSEIEGKDLAEAIIRKAAKTDPIAALKHAKAYWKQPWGPSVAKEAMTGISPSAFTPEELKEAPWRNHATLAWKD